MGDSWRECLWTMRIVVAPRTLIRDLTRGRDYETRFGMVTVELKQNN
jgi:hypothetical protein